MHLRLKIITIALIGSLAGCASLGAVNAPQAERTGLTPRTLLSGECGLFVWKADQAKTFILFADRNSAAYYQDGAEVSLTPVAKADISTERLFMDPNGKRLSLSLRQSQSFQESTRYKSGSLISLDDSGWEIVTPVVGLFSCQT